jgi:hypothetical protein
LLCRHLAEVVGAALHVLNVHAGTSPEAILEAARTAEEAAAAAAHGVWLFLDEINTCTHLGLISDLVCNRLLQVSPAQPPCSHPSRHSVRQHGSLRHMRRKRGCHMIEC